MSSQIGLIASRGTEGLNLFSNTVTKHPSSFNDAEFTDQLNDAKLTFRSMKFSNNGKLFAYINEEKGCHIYCTLTNKIVSTIPLPRTNMIQFSPKGNYICLSQPNYARQDKTIKAEPNITIWEIASTTKINEIFHTKGEWSGFLWAPNDEWYGRISADRKQILFFEPSHASKVVNKIVSPDGAAFAAFAVGEGRKPNGEVDPLVAVFNPEFRAQPAKVRVYKYPEFEACLAAKSFFKAEEARLYWSNSARAVVVLASTAIDKSGQSYYGATQVHHLCTRGRSAGDASLVPLSKGPVYDVAWHPNKENFCVVYGFMPSKATVFTSPKLGVLFTADNISKNQCLYSPGNTGMLALCGFGNLGGKVEVWKLEDKTRICEFESVDTTYFEWSADGKHFLAATTSPRLRTDNRIDLLTCTGKKLWRIPSAELWESAFQPRPDITANATELSLSEIKVAQKETKQRDQQEKSRKFIPPHLRRQLNANQPQTTDLKSLQNKAKALKKKLGQVKGLKADQSQGKSLNEDQLEKLKSESTFQSELSELEQQLASMK